MITCPDDPGWQYHKFEFKDDINDEGEKMQVSNNHRASKGTKQQADSNSNAMITKNDRKCSIPLLFMPRQIFPLILFIY
jgi:hypothetical protein